MIASQPSSFSSIAGGWPLQDTITHQHNYHIYTQTNIEASESLVHCPPFRLDHFTPSTPISSNPTTVQKLCHNARERNRRKKINNLFSTLRSLLPATHDDPMKTLSIPATVSGVVKYIPELQEQVEGLIQKKEELLSRISRQEQQTRQENPRQLPAQSSSSAVAASWLNDREVMIQISTYKSPLSEILLNLEQDGFQLLNASAFESFGGRVFHNLHLQLERTDKLEHAYEVLSEKLLSLYEKGGAI